MLHFVFSLHLVPGCIQNLNNNSIATSFVSLFFSTWVLDIARYPEKPSAGITISIKRRPLCNVTVVMSVSKFCHCSLYLPRDTHNSCQWTTTNTEDCCKSIITMTQRCFHLPCSLLPRKPALVPSVRYAPTVTQQSSSTQSSQRSTQKVTCQLGVTHRRLVVIHFDAWELYTWELINALGIWWPVAWREGL